MKTGNLIFLSGAASLAIVVIGTFSTVHAGTLPGCYKIEGDGYSTIKYVGKEYQWTADQCVGLHAPQPNARNETQAAAPVDPQPEPEEPGHTCGHGGGFDWGDFFDSLFG